jgi:hypothetical protein
MMEVLTLPIRKTSTCLTLASLPLTGTAASRTRARGDLWLQETGESAVVSEENLGEIRRLRVGIGRSSW